MPLVLHMLHLFRVPWECYYEREGGTLANANIRESTRTRTLVQSLVNEDEGICVEAIKNIQHFLMFASDYVDVPDLVQRFRGHLNSTTRRPLKIASINALYQLVRKDALAMSKLGGDCLVEDLFGLLDDDQHPTSVHGSSRRHAKGIGGPTFVSCRLPRFRQRRRRLIVLGGFKQQ
jgi:hypothetical protein